MRMLITGASGMLGHRLVRLAAERHEVWGSYGSFPVSVARAHTFAVELTDEAQVRHRLLSLRPEVIVHTAALTDVDACERDPVRARSVNTEATRNLAALAEELGARFVYISTDYVFDGEKGDYGELDPPCPVNVYGETKLLGEEAARQLCSRALVIRTCIFGLQIQPKTGLVEYVMNALESGKSISRFADQFSTPIYTGDLSRLILKLLDLGATGLFHAGGGEKVSRYDFSLEVADIFSLAREWLKSEPFRQIQGLARRPRDSSLDGRGTERHLGMRLPRVREGLERLREDWRVFSPARGAP